MWTGWESGSSRRWRPCYRRTLRSLHDHGLRLEVHDELLNIEIKHSVLAVAGEGMSGASRYIPSILLPGLHLKERKPDYYVDILWILLEPRLGPSTLDCFRTGNIANLVYWLRLLRSDAFKDKTERNLVRNLPFAYVVSCGLEIVIHFLRSNPFLDCAKRYTIQIRNSMMRVGIMNLFVCQRLRVLIFRNKTF